MSIDWGSIASAIISYYSTQQQSNAINQASNQQANMTQAGLDQQYNMWSTMYSDFMPYLAGGQYGLQQLVYNVPSYLQNNIAPYYNEFMNYSPGNLPDPSQYTVNPVTGQIGTGQTPQTTNPIQNQQLSQPGTSQNGNYPGSRPGYDAFGNRVDQNGNPIAGAGGNILTGSNAQQTGETALSANLPYNGYRLSGAGVGDGPGEGPGAGTAGNAGGLGGSGGGGGSGGNVGGGGTAGGGGQFSGLSAAEASAALGGSGGQAGGGSSAGSSGAGASGGNISNTGQAITGNTAIGNSVANALNGITPDALAAALGAIPGMQGVAAALSQSGNFGNASASPDTGTQGGPGNGGAENAQLASLANALATYYTTGKMPPMNALANQIAGTPVNNSSNLFQYTPYQGMAQQTPQTLNVSQDDLTQGGVLSPLSPDLPGELNFQFNAEDPNYKYALGEKNKEIDSFLSKNGRLGSTSGESYRQSELDKIRKAYEDEQYNRAVSERDYSKDNLLTKYSMDTTRGDTLYNRLTGQSGNLYNSYLQNALTANDVNTNLLNQRLGAGQSAYNTQYGSAYDLANLGQGSAQSSGSGSINTGNSMAQGMSNLGTQLGQGTMANSNLWSQFLSGLQNQNYGG
jgi:hypothetical protein